MEERIKKLRKYLHLTQVEFGARIGLQGSTVTTYEKGQRIPSNAVFVAMCREYGVNEDWLRNGTGEMLSRQESTRAAEARRLADMYAHSDEMTYSVLHAYLTLSDSDREVIHRLLRKIASGAASTVSEAATLTEADLLVEADVESETP